MNSTILIILGFILGVVIKGEMDKEKKEQEMKQKEGKKHEE